MPPPVHCKLRWTERAAAALALCAVVVAGLWLRTLSPGELQRIPSCPVVRTTGLLCPGCGSTRACHAALRGEWKSAVRYNPVAAAIGAPAAGLTMLGLLGMAMTGRVRTIRAPAALGWAVVGVVAVWTIGRNLPFDCFESWRPPPVSARAATPPR